MRILKPGSLVKLAAYLKDDQWPVLDHGRLWVVEEFNTLKKDNDFPYKIKAVATGFVAFANPCHFEVNDAAD